VVAGGRESSDHDTTNLSDSFMESNKTDSFIRSSVKKAKTALIRDLQKSPRIAQARQKPDYAKLLSPADLLEVKKLPHLHKFMRYKEDMTKFYSQVDKIDKELKVIQKSRELKGSNRLEKNYNLSNKKALYWNLKQYC